MCVPSFAHRQRATSTTSSNNAIINKDLLLASFPLKYGAGSPLTSLFFTTEQPPPQPQEQQQQQPQNHPQIIAQHDYHDRTNAVGTFGTEEAAVTKGGVGLPFPARLHDMLQNVQDDGLEFIISWQPHGRCFVVHDPKGFVEVVLPKHFKQSKLSSFQRQLNLYGFQRLTKGNDKGGYYHEYFLRGHVDLCSHIHRIKVKGTKVRARSNPDAEPDLWKMSWVSSEEGKVRPPLLPVEKSTRLPSRIVSSQPIMLSGPVMSSDNFDVFFFEGKAFHAVESEKLLENSKSVVSQAVLDEWDDDIDYILVDIELPSNFHLDIIGAIDDDSAFGDLLERLIDES